MRYLFVLLLLAGCATQEERAERAIARYAPYCEKLGHAQDTDPWRHCIQMQSANDTSARQRAQQNANQVIYAK